MKRFLPFAVKGVVVVCMVVCACLSCMSDEVAQIQNIRFFSSKGNFEAVKVVVESSAPLEGFYSITGGEGKERRVVATIRTFSSEKLRYDAPHPLLESVVARSSAGGTRIEFAMRKGTVLNTSELDGKGRKLSLYFRAEAVGVKNAVADVFDGEEDPEPWKSFLGVPDEYRLGMGDRLQITVYQHADLSINSIMVPSEGAIEYPLLGQIQLTGRTVDEIRKEIYEKLAADYIVNPQVSVIATQYESKWIFVGGAVRNPKKMFISGPFSVMKALTEAGGVVPTIQNVAPVAVFLSRRVSEEVKVLRIPLSELQSPVSPYQEINLQSGDILEVVPPDSPFILVTGEVKSPGLIPFEDNLTVYRVILKAGGLNEWGNPRSVELIREENGRQKKYSINLNKIQEGNAQDMPLLPEDMIVVKRRLL